MQQENDCQENVWQWMTLAEKTPRKKPNECSLVRRYILKILMMEQGYPGFYLLPLGFQLKDVQICLLAQEIFDLSLNEIPNTSGQTNKLHNLLYFLHR